MIEAFANLYADFAAALEPAPLSERAPPPGINEGIRGMRFVDRALRSAGGEGWISMEERLP
jgi:hypothetical protein